MFELSNAADQISGQTTAVAILVPGGYSDDAEFGIDGFAHLREHWALAVIDKIFEPSCVVRRSAKTLRATTELNLLLFGRFEMDASTLLDSLLEYRGVDLAREIVAIDEEVRQARSNPSAVVADEVLPRRLGWSSGWGFGEPDVLTELGSDDFFTIVEHSWSGVHPIATTLDISSIAHPYDRGSGALLEETRATAPDLVSVISSSGPADMDAEYAEAAVGWVIGYGSPFGIKVADDCLRFVNSVAPSLLGNEFPNLRIHLRLGQFGEQFTSAESDLVVGWISVRNGPVPATTIRAYVRAILKTARELLESGSVSFGALDNRCRLDAVLRGSDPLQRAVWHSRARHTGLGSAHPYLCDPAEVVFAERRDSVRVIRLLEEAEFQLVGGGAQ